MESKVVEYRDDEYNVRITVRRATYRDGFKRSLLTERARTAAKLENDAAGVDLSIDMLADQMALMFSYPSIIACTSAIENVNPFRTALELDVKGLAFINLPDRLVNSWEAAALILNPHWMPGGEAPEADAEIESPLSAPATSVSEPLTPTSSPGLNG